jgi:hypothetical protein
MEWEMEKLLMPIESIDISGISKHCTSTVFSDKCFLPKNLWQSCNLQEPYFLQFSTKMHKMK